MQITFHFVALKREFCNNTKLSSDSELFQLTDERYEAADETQLY